MLPPAGGGWGTWREAGVAPAAALRRVPSDLPLALAATLAVNPPTALRLLEDFAALQPGVRRDAAHGRGQPDADAAPITCTPASGDTLVQNGAGSGVGRAIIQLAAARGVCTVNILRDRRACQLQAVARKRVHARARPRRTLTRASRCRPDFEAAAAELRALGATLVLRPDAARRDASAAAALRALPPAKLGALPACTRAARARCDGAAAC